MSIEVGLARRAKLRRRDMDEYRSTVLVRYDWIFANDIQIRVALGMEYCKAQRAGMSVEIELARRASSVGAICMKITLYSDPKM